MGNQTETTATISVGMAEPHSKTVQRYGMKDKQTCDLLTPLYNDVFDITLYATNSGIEITGIQALHVMHALDRARIIADQLGWKIQFDTRTDKLITHLNNTTVIC